MIRKSLTTIVRVFSQFWSQCVIPGGFYMKQDTILAEILPYMLPTPIPTPKIGRSKPWMKRFTTN